MKGIRLPNFKTVRLIGERNIRYKHRRIKTFITSDDPSIEHYAKVIPTKDLILTFNTPKLPTTIKAGYLNCKIRPYIPNPLRCFKCQRFGHSRTSCRGQLICSRYATVGHYSTDCALEAKSINCSQPHSADSKLYPKWKTEKQIQEVKTNRNITYLEARKLIAPPISQTYSQAAKSSTISVSTQTDENITEIKYPPLTLLQPSSLPKPNISPSIPSVSASSAQADLLTSTPPIAAIISESPPVNPITNYDPYTSNIFAFPSNSGVKPSSASPSIQDTKLKAKARFRKKKKQLLKKMNDAMFEIKRKQHKPGHDRVRSQRI
ncbi:RNA-directed DNA polymerase from mobile element jockey [Trichonephila clavipes]|uniref:RNA-directed DNA polymerase from mobile element jockey n=1 Tax=Trichonephila clavipes TaxID=2585209 RepID=A0A8X6SRP9_TRICX|nr:RNA-directed DNA polymerase from mobile element jockey [Trichonephila clavipes]